MSLGKPRQRRVRSVQVVLWVCLLSLIHALGQAAPIEEDEPLFEQLSKNFKKSYLRIGALLQTVGDFQIDRSFANRNGFNISNFRLNVGGELDRGFGYFLQANFVNSPALLDAKMYYQISPNTNLDIGLYKAPFSKELLTSAASIDFVNRSQVVSALAPARQIGVQLRGSFTDQVAYAVGMFNGNGFRGNLNDNDSFMYAGRLTLLPTLADQADRLEIGLNVAYSKDDNATLVSGLLRNFDGDRTLFGGDLRWTHRRFLVSGEFIYSQLDRTVGPTSNVVGFHATGGYMVREKHQLLVRLDTLSPDNLADDSHLLVFGYNYWPTQATEFQVNYIVLTDDAAIDHHQILINAQVGF